MNETPFLPDRLFGIEVFASEHLPKTVKDKDGKERELLGVLQEGEYDVVRGEIPRFTLLLGEEVK